MVFVGNLKPVKQSQKYEANFQGSPAGLPQCCVMLASLEEAFRLQQRDANTKESKHTVLESDNFPLRRPPLLFDNNL